MTIHKIPIYLGGIKNTHKKQKICLLLFCLLYFSVVNKIWSQTSDPIVIAVIDLKINENHGSFTGKLLKKSENSSYNGPVSYDAATANYYNHYKTNHYSSNYEYPRSQYNSVDNDDSGHGTSVAMAVANSIGSNDNIKIALVNLDDEYHTKRFNNQIIDAINWAVNVANADVINFSLQLNNVEDALGYAARNAIVTFAAGNEDNIQISFPGNDTSLKGTVLTVGAVDSIYDNKIKDSRYGPHLDIVAPVGPDDFTSIATPKVAVVAAKVLEKAKSLNRHLSNAAVREIILQNTSHPDLGNSYPPYPKNDTNAEISTKDQHGVDGLKRNDEYGFGLVNADNAVNAVENYENYTIIEETNYCNHYTANNDTFLYYAYTSLIGAGEIANIHYEHKVAFEHFPIESSENSGAKAEISSLKAIKLGQKTEVQKGAKAHFFIDENRTCPETSATKVAKDASIISNNTETTDLNIHPNPNHGIFSVESANEIDSYIISNTYGKQIAIKNVVKNTNVNIDISNYSNGIYFLQLYFTNGEIVHQKIIKK